MEYEFNNKRKSKQELANIVNIITGILFITIAAVLVVVFLLQGSTTVTNGKIDDVKTTALNCTSDVIRYPIFTYDNTNKRELSIKMVFSEKSLETIALSYSLFYDNENLIVASEAHNHAAMNISYGKNGFEPDAFNTKYAILDDRLRINLYANSKDISEASAKYFLIDTETNMPNALEEYSRNYTTQGFICEATE